MHISVMQLLCKWSGYFSNGYIILLHDPTITLIAASKRNENIVHGSIINHSLEVEAIQQSSQVWWYTPVIQTLVGYKQENYSRLAVATY